MDAAQTQTTTLRLVGSVENVSAAWKPYAIDRGSFSGPGHRMVFGGWEIGAHLRGIAIAKALEENEKSISLQYLTLVSEPHALVSAISEPSNIKTAVSHTENLCTHWSPVAKIKDEALERETRAAADATQRLNDLNAKLYYCFHRLELQSALGSVGIDINTIQRETVFEECEALAAFVFRETGLSIAGQDFAMDLFDHLGQGENSSALKQELSVELRAIEEAFDRVRTAMTKSFERDSKSLDAGEAYDQFETIRGLIEIVRVNANPLANTVRILSNTTGVDIFGDLVVQIQKLHEEAVNFSAKFEERQVLLATDQVSSVSRSLFENEEIQAKAPRLFAVFISTALHEALKNRGVGPHGMKIINDRDFCEKLFQRIDIWSPMIASSYRNRSAHFDPQTIKGFRGSSDFRYPPAQFWSLVFANALKQFTESFVGNAVKAIMAAENNKSPAPVAV